MKDNSGSTRLMSAMVASSRHHRAHAGPSHERVDVVLVGEHGGRVDGGADEDVSVNLASFRHPEDLGHRPRRRV